MASSSNYLGFSSKQPDLQAGIAREKYYHGLRKSPSCTAIIVQVRSEFPTTVHTDGHSRIQTALVYSQDMDTAYLIPDLRAKTPLNSYTENNFQKKHLRPAFPPLPHPK